METVEALITNITFRNDDTGFTVLQVRLDNGKRTAAVGVFPVLAEGERVRLTGEWTEHSQFGLQLKVSLFEPLRPTTSAAMERYLASGIIKGVGAATAKQIVQHFGTETLNILTADPMRLREIPGIGQKRAEMISSSFAANEESREAMVFLQEYGVSPALAQKIYKRYKENTRIVIRETPYKLVEDIRGIGFHTADRIAASIGIAPNAPERIHAGILYVLSDASASSGHTYLPREMLIQQSCTMLQAERELVESQLSELELQKKVITLAKEEHEAVYLPPFLRAETDTARFLLTLHEALPYHPDSTINADISAWEKLADVTLSENQRAAVRAAVTEGVSVITGGPGTGKTTIIRCIIYLLRGYDIVLAAPTGRAAKRMSEATGQEARTLHRLLEYSGEESAFAKGEDDPINADVIIVDEMSMVDIFLMRAFLRAVIPGTKLVLVGDADQLPSVGPGNVLRDILCSDVIPTTWLHEIYRQSEESMIVYNAHLINQGKMPLLNQRGGDFFLNACDSTQKCCEDLLNLCAERLPNYLNADPLRDIQVLSPMKKGDCGVFALNTLLQAHFNPPARGKPECRYSDTTFRCGDKVMQTRNDYQMEWTRRFSGASEEDGTGIFNGDMGIVLDVDEDERTVTVRFDDDREAVYEYAQLEDLELAYCISVHKSQGSEFPVVVMPVMGGPMMLLTRNLFYTAVTRARKMVVLVGRRSVIASMVQNTHIALRYSSLCDWLKSYSDGGGIL